MSSSSLPTRSLSQHLRHSSHPSQSPPALVARIEEKRAELENLRQLRDLSAAMAGQMEALEQKLSTLTDGTEAIAAVVGNWHNVLRTINMASAILVKPPVRAAKREGTGEETERESGPEERGQEGRALPLPQTLVRIPTEHAPTVQAHAEEADASIAADMEGV